MYWNCSIYILKVIMKSAHNPELDDILLNLMNSRQYRKPKWKAALKYRQLKASTGLQLKNTQKSSKSLLDLSHYQRYGTGVTLYFNILHFLIITFIILSINSIPMLICNLKGNGLDVYADGGFTNTLMKVSLANQNRHKLQTLIQSPNLFRDMMVSQGIIVFCDILSTIIFLCFLIYWQIRSDRIISELLSENVLPSSYTIIVTNLPKQNYSQEKLKIHFNRFGQVIQISTVYDLSIFMKGIQQFIGLVDEYATGDVFERQKKYYQLQQKYQQIKNHFSGSAKISPVCAFITFNHLSTRNVVQNIYKYKIHEEQLFFQSSMLHIEKCKVEPSSIIWQNFHLKQITERKKSILIYFLLFFVLVSALISFFLIHAHSNKLKQTEQIHIDPTKDYTYDQVMQNNSKDSLFNFCSKLQAFSFQWKYYILCIPYYESYQEKIVAMLSLSLLIVAINYILSLIIYALGEFRRYKTKTQKGSFLIINTFIVYFINTGLLILLIRADFDGYSLSGLMKIILPNKVGEFNIEVYKDFNRKWYFHIGSQVIFNYAVSLIISPFFQILFGWIYTRLRFFLARWAKTQKQMNEFIVDSEFSFETYYAMLLNSVFYCMFYANAIPILYTFAIFSILSIYIASVIIFKYFSCKPAMFDHSLNNIISKVMIIALLIHQLTSIVFYFVDDVFPYDGDHKYSLIHKFHDGIVYLVIILILVLFLVFHDYIVSWVKIYWNKKFKQRLSREHMKAESQLKFTDVFFERRHKYLSSYRMEDNPIYFNLSYTLSVFKIIISKAINQKQENDNQNDNDQEEFKQSSKCINVQLNDFL